MRFGIGQPVTRKEDAAEKLAFNLSASHLDEGCEHHATTRCRRLGTNGRRERQLDRADLGTPPNSRRGVQ